MHIKKGHNKKSISAAAAQQAATIITSAISTRGEASIVIATGASQLDFLASLVQEDVNWSTVTAFHLDEYIGLADSHPASFRKYLKERFVEKATGLREFVYVNGSAPDPEEECRRLSERIAQHSIDLACIGIGENGHLAFNDPPANFSLKTPYHVVDLDERCRMQQVGEGWFSSLDEVPTRAISMSIHHILTAQAIICTVPGAPKAEAVAKTCEGPVTEDVPASILTTMDQCYLYIDTDSAAMLRKTIQDLEMTD